MIAQRCHSALAAIAVLSSVVFAHAAPTASPAQPVPDPGKAIASDDDSSAIAVNPANLAFLPDPEFRWTWVRTSSASPLPARGHSFSVAVPLFILSTGFRVDLLDPPEAAPPPFDATSRWFRWALAFGSDTASFGTTFGWGTSGSRALHGFFSLTSGITTRPLPFLSFSAIARDWNKPQNDAGTLTVERSYDLGLAIRPVEGRRDFEIGLETAYFEDSDAWVPRATLGLDIPRVGRLRGDIEVRDIDKSTRTFAMTAGLDINMAMLQASGGGVFGNAFTNSGAGFYAGAALRAFREPGVRLPAHVAKIVIDSTPEVRAHTRLLRRLWKLADNPEVEGVVLVMSAEPAENLAHAEELGDAIRMLRAYGKKVICHLEDAGGRSLHVCSQADVIAMNPAGGLRFAGMSSKYFYFGSLLQKLGVRSDFVRIGDHKLAAEQLTLEHGSQIGNLDHQELLEQLNQVLLHDVGGGRKIPLRELQKRIAKGPFLAKEAKDAKLIDLVAYQDELDRVVDETFGHSSRLVDDEPESEAPEQWGKVPKVAIVYLDGDMVDGESQDIPFAGVRLAGSTTIVKALKKARDDRSVKAIVFRVETGGGSSLAADVILREAILTARAKPLVVSMGSHAASGGYYASSIKGAPIFANRGTITGSIGIFYGKVDVSNLLTKLGVHIDSFRTTPRADAESFFRPFTDDEREVLGQKVKQFYDVFVARVAEGRSMNVEDVDAIARGRVWTGQQAKDRKLVDHIGGLREALAEARKRGNLPDDAPIISLPDEESLLGLLLNLAGASVAASQPALAQAVIPPAFLEIARALTPFLVFDSTKPLARLEFAQEVQMGGRSKPRATASEER